MLDISSNEQTEALYKMIQIKGGKRIEKFSSTDINEILKFQKWFAKRYREGLLMEIYPQKKIYDNIEKKVKYIFD